MVHTSFGIAHAISLKLTKLLQESSNSFQSKVGMVVLARPVTLKFHPHPRPYVHVPLGKTLNSAVCL